MTRGGDGEARGGPTFGEGGPGVPAGGQKHDAGSPYRAFSVPTFVGVIPWLWKAAMRLFHTGRGCPWGGSSYTCGARLLGAQERPTGTRPR